MHVVFCNCPPDDAVRIARTVVEEGLAACANLVAVQSVYVWQGAVVDEPETTVLFKTAVAEALRVRLLQLHPYDVPEVIAVAVDEDASSADYLQWVRSQAR